MVEMVEMISPCDVRDVGDVLIEYSGTKTGLGFSHFLEWMFECNSQIHQPWLIKYWVPPH